MVLSRGEKSRTGSIMAAKEVVGSATRYWNVQVVGSKRGVIVGSGDEGDEVGEGEVMEGEGEVEVL